MLVIVECPIWRDPCFLPGACYAADRPICTTRPQLLGMADHLTFALGAEGFKAYKYVPYGPLTEVMPYLMRRAQENCDALSGASVERIMMLCEVRRRILGF